MQACLTRMPLSALAALLLGSLLSCSAQYNVPTGEWMVATSRLMIADNNPNNTNVAVVELPSFTLSHRVSVPGITQQLGLTADHKSMAVFRARGGNDQHFINFMSTGLVTMSGAVTTNSTVAPVVMPGYMRRMAITRSMFAVNGNDASMGAENGVELLYHPRWKTHLLYAETHGLVATYNATEAAMSGDFSFSKTMYVPIGHYHLVVVDNYIFAAHTGTGEAIMVDQEGTVVNRFPCARCHGSEKYETEEYTIVLFGCIDSVLAVTVPHSHTGEDNHTVEEHHPSEDNHTGEEHHPSEENHTREEQHPSEENHTREEQHPSEENHTSEEDHTGHDHDRRLASTSDVTATYINASNPRIGGFTEGAPGVFWTAAQSGPFIATPRFYRTDTRGTPKVTLTNHSGTGLGSDGFVIRAQGLPSKHRMLAIHRVGLMVMYHGVTGEAISSINLSEGGFSANFASPYVTPFLSNSTVFITVPATGNVHEILVNFTSGVMSMGRVLSLGGQPQMALVAEQEKAMA